MDTPYGYTISQVVASAFNRIPLDTKHRERLSAIAVEHLGDLNIFHPDHKRVAYLDISTINTVQLPKDYIDYIKPPAIVVNGMIWTLTKADGIATGADISCGNPVNPAPDNITSQLLTFVQDNNIYWQHYGAYGGQNVCYFTIDKANRLIVLKGSIPTGKLLLVYTSTGISLDEDTIVPREVVPTLRAYLIWQSIENDPRVAANEKDRKRMQYYDELGLLIRFQNSLSATEWMDIFYSTSKQVPKR